MTIIVHIPLYVKEIILNERKGYTGVVKKSKNDNALAELIAAAPPEALSELILELAAGSPEIRRECFDYLKENTAVSKMLKSRSEGENIMSTWAELLPDLEELDAYGGGPFMGWKTRCGNCCMTLQNV